ncbi:MAG: hypothetical protein LBP78_08325 [Acidaminococcales bacterium]|jgi:Skp family chaperone for outer membrane proteins|nr:hypothetical protein [Acidaminococcales bacterium]
MKATNKTGTINITEALGKHPGAEKVFAAIMKTRESIQWEYGREAKSLPDDEKRKLSARLGQKAAAIEKELAKTLVADINKAVDEIFQKEGYALILSDSAVVRGGTNITDKVIQKVREAAATTEQ